MFIMQNNEKKSFNLCCILFYCLQKLQQ